MDDGKVRVTRGFAHGGGLYPVEASYFSQDRTFSGSLCRDPPPSFGEFPINYMVYLRSMLLCSGDQGHKAEGQPTELTSASPFTIEGNVCLQRVIVKHTSLEYDHATNPYILLMYYIQQ